MDPLTQDRLVWHWNPSGIYSSKSAYDAMFIGQSATLGAKELWSTRAPNKCMFYLWTVLHCRVWFSARLHRHGLPNNVPCDFCDQMDETLDHLLVGCVFSRETWFKLLRRCGWSQVSPAPDDAFVDWWLQSRKRIPKLHQKAFNSFVTLIAWSLWCHRNDRVFSRKCVSPGCLVDEIWDTGEL
jgi:hypothetical protein